MERRDAVHSFLGNSKPKMKIISSKLFVLFYILPLIIGVLGHWLLSILHVPITGDSFWIGTSIIYFLLTIYCYINHIKHMLETIFGTYLLMTIIAISVQIFFFIFSENFVNWIIFIVLVLPFGIAFHKSTKNYVSSEIDVLLEGKE